MSYKTVLHNYYPLIKITERFYSKNVINFLQNEPDLSGLIKYIPAKYLNYSSTIANEHFYLICPKAAKTIADHVVGSVHGNQIVAETNTGLGLITTELLEKGIDQVRMYETCHEFRQELKNFALAYPGRIELFVKNLFHLGRFAYLDKQDGMNRVDSLLKNVPRKAWTDDPAMTVIGTMPNKQFLNYLIRTMVLQTGPSLYGRMQIFGILHNRDYKVLSASPDKELKSYTSTSIMFQLFFDFEKLETFPRSIFLPWERSRKNKDKENEMVLVKINFKKQIPVPYDQLLPLFYFAKQLTGSRNKMIIPTLESCAPSCGENILVPKLKHNNYFTDINIFTKFKELTPPQYLAIFKEVVNTSTYAGSPFKAIIEQELIKSETIETSLADNVLEKRIVRDVESLNYQDDID